MRCLIFGTTYVDGPARLRLLNQWIDLNERLNPECDLLMVDTPSGYKFEPTHSRPLMRHQFPDNVGHMARGGRDGWGRAFSEGLAIAIAHGYDYVAHVEGDSLLRLPIKRQFEYMRRHSLHVTSIPVMGTKTQEKDWVETGLMLMSVAHAKQINLVANYNWPAGGKLYPNNTPERVLHRLLGGDLTMMPWRGQRDQARKLTPETAARLDWVTDTTPECFEAFYSAAKLSADYTSKFFEMHEAWRDDYRAIADLLDVRGQFDTASVIDLGCGNAYIIERLRERGSKVVVGVDGSAKVLERWPEAIIHDLAKPLDIGKYELVICTEVAEHLPPEAADALVDNVCNAMNDDRYAAAFFSAAKPGRGGEHHLNEQSAYYWIEKFGRRGMYFDVETTKELRWRIANGTSAIWWFAVNTLVFRRVVA